MKYQSYCAIEENIIQNDIAGATGIYLEYADNDIIVTKNKISLEDAVAGIRLYRCDGIMGLEGLIANNFIGLTGVS